jgi:flavin-dependent dehydrogenase
MLMTEPASARSLTADGYTGWHALLSRTRLLAPRLAACVLAEQYIRAHSVTSGILDPVQGDHWLAVGDAASVYDPIASQGIYKAFADAADACAAITSPASSSRYSDRVAARFEDYLVVRAHLYALEQRFAQQPFWRTRQLAAPAAR